MVSRRLGALVIVSLALGAGGGAAAWSAGARGPDPDCTGAYGGARPRPAALRFGVDPGIAGSIGTTQGPAAPEDPARELAAVRALRVPGHPLVVRLNRLFWSGGAPLLARFRSRATRYTRAGLLVEVQVRYHPGPGEAGKLGAWRRYVRHVVDAFGADRRVVAMTITNEVNLPVSPNTSDGSFPGADAALVSGIEAAHAEALRRGFTQLRFGFTYAYRFAPAGDAALFAYVGRRGGGALRRALGFVGLDVYPGQVYPPVLGAGGYRGALAQALGVLRRCLMPRAGLGRGIPIWITETGAPSGNAGGAGGQRAAVRALVLAARAYAGTFGVSDFRWFNLRDSGAGAAGLFATDGLLAADYRPKPAFAAYRRLIAATP